MMTSAFPTLPGTLTFKSKLNGAFHIKLTYNGISIEVETWVSYNLQDAVVDVSDNFAQEIPIAKLPIVGVPGIGLEVGMGLGLFTEGDTEVSFDLTGGKAGFTAKGGNFQSPSFSSLSEKPKLNVEEIIAEGDFEVDLTFGPSIDVLSVAGLGCDIAEAFAFRPSSRRRGQAENPSPAGGKAFQSQCMARLQGAFLPAGRNRYAWQAGSLVPAGWTRLVRGL